MTTSGPSTSAPSPTVVSTTPSFRDDICSSAARERFTTTAYGNGLIGRVPAARGRASRSVGDDTTVPNGPEPRREGTILPVPSRRVSALRARIPHATATTTATAEPHSPRGVPRSSTASPAPSASPADGLRFAFGTLTVLPAGLTGRNSAYRSTSSMTLDARAHATLELTICPGSWVAMTATRRCPGAATSATPPAPTSRRGQTPLERRTQSSASALPAGETTRHTSIDAGLRRPANRAYFRPAHVRSNLQSVF